MFFGIRGIGLSTFRVPSLSPFHLYARLKPRSIISVVLRWLWEGGTLMVLSRLMSHHRRFRHCLSLDTGVLQVCIGLHNLSAAAAAAANYEDLGDGLSSQRAVLAALESAAVLGDVASNHLLAAKSRKANLLESVILGAATVINDKKGSGDIHRIIILFG